MTTNEIIRTRRQQMKMSQDDLAKRAGYSDRSSIAKIEAGLVDLSESKIKLFAEILCVTPAELMGFCTIPETPQSSIHSSDDERLLDMFHDLNPEGQRAALASIRGLLNDPIYKNSSDSPELLDA